MSNRGVVERPNARRIGARSLVLGALVLRATLEMNPGHPRSSGLVQASRAWLERAGVWETEVEPLEAAILEKPLGCLSDGQLMDCRWSGEDLAVTLWALRRVPMPAEWVPVDPTPMFDSIGLMKEDASNVLEAEVRSISELRLCYKRLSLFRWALRDARLPNESGHHSRDALLSVLRSSLGRVGLELTVGEAETIRHEVARLSKQDIAGETHLSGIVVVRQMAAEWLVGLRTRFWDSSS